MTTKYSQYMLSNLITPNFHTKAVSLYIFSRPQIPAMKKIGSIEKKGLNFSREKNISFI